MTDLKNKVNALNKLIINGDTIMAMEIFYASDIEMQENEDTPRKGKMVCIATEKSNLQKVKNVESKLLNQAVDEEKNIVFSEWEILVTYNDDRKFMLKQVSVQHWLNGQIIHEKFYYKTIHKVD